jgi:hypothetical protein
MDHKVSKDMISSGMIPSGEKTQADLGRIQYGSAPSPSSLMDAYKSIYEHHQKDKDGNTIPHEGEQLNEGKMPEGLKNYLMKKKGKKEDKKDMKEGLGTVAGGAYGYKTGGVKGAVVGGTAGAVLDKMSKKKKPEVKEDKEQVNEILGFAAGALGAMKGVAAGKAAGALAGKAAMKKAVASGLTKTASGKAAAKMGARAAAMKTGMGAAVSKGAMGALNYGTAGSIAGSALGGITKVATQPVTKKPSGTISADVDLFDIVKGKLLDEGLTEEESLDVMLTLTLEEINEVIQLDEISAGLMMKAAKAAEVARGKAAVVGNKALAMKKLGQGEKFYKGAVAKRKAAGQMGAGYKEGM